MLGRLSQRKLFAIRRLSSARSLSTVGVVGAGNMGRGIAASLARSGFGVAQYDITADLLASSAAQHEAIQAADSLAVLCRLADAGVVVSVAGEAAERAVFLGPGGLCEVAPAGALLVDCGTVTVDFARELHGTCGARGLRFLDAPVSGGPEGAANGTLSIMVGGAAADFEAARPVLDGMGGYVVRMGDGGAGALAKLINQLLTASNSLAASEALALARRSGLDDPASLKALLALLERSWGNSTMLQRTGGLVKDALAAPAATRDALAAPAMAPMRNFAKDVDFVLLAAKGAGLTLPATRAARDAVSRAAALSLDGADWAYVTEMHHPDHQAMAAAASSPLPAAAIAWWSG